jgi:hypothetical protein
MDLFSSYPISNLMVAKEDVGLHKPFVRKHFTKRRNSGQLWNLYLGGLAIIAVVGILYVILYQATTANIVPIGTSQGADTTTSNYISIAWLVVPAIVVIAWVFSMIGAGKLMAGGVGSYD